MEDRSSEPMHHNAVPDSEGGWVSLLSFPIWNVHIVELLLGSQLAAFQSLVSRL